MGILIPFLLPFAHAIGTAEGAGIAVFYLGFPAAAVLLLVFVGRNPLEFV